MTDQTDFAGLYRELGLGPDCSLDAFRLAYRRRVAGLHPDRIGASGEADLKDLNLRYNAALDFHRHYGRLPGASPQPSSSGARGATELRQQSIDERQGVEPPPRKSSKGVVYGMMVLVAVLMWWMSRTEAESWGIHGPGNDDIERGMAIPSAKPLRAGMSPQEVIALSGATSGRKHGSSHRTCGSSWVFFECTRIVDGYGSLQQSLKAAEPMPGNAGLAGLRPFEARRHPAVPQRSPRRGLSWP